MRLAFAPTVSSRILHLKTIHPNSDDQSWGEMATRTGLTPLRYVYAVRCLLLADRPHRFATYAPMGLCGLRSNPTGSRPVYFTTSQKTIHPNSDDQSWGEMATRTGLEPVLPP